jgi:hypothetical protein
LKFLSPKNYRRYNTFIEGINSNNIDSDFLFEYFRNKEKTELIKEAFKIPDITYIYDHEIEEYKKSNLPLIEKMYRMEIFTFELVRENYISYHEAKLNNLFTIFPYLDLSTVKYFIDIPINKKVKNIETKHIIKKILSKYLPKKMVYKKKNWDHANYQNFYLKDENFSSIIKEIKSMNYDFFDFDIDLIFSNKKYDDLALKLINFHIWYKMFIDN